MQQVTSEPTAWMRQSVEDRHTPGIGLSGYYPQVLPIYKVAERGPCLFFIRACTYDIGYNAWTRFQFIVCTDGKAWATTNQRGKTFAEAYHEASKFFKAKCSE